MFDLAGAVLLAQVGLGIDRTPPTSAPRPAPPAVTCAQAADPALVGISQQRTGASPSMDQFTIHVTVLNRGTAGQKPTVRQAVSVYQNDERIAKFIVPPLDAGVAYAFSTRFKRSSEAGVGSTTLIFRFGIYNYAHRSAQDCDDRNDTATLTF